jgi:diaminopimelate decarboxylase
MKLPENLGVKDGHLTIGGVDTLELADEFDTPLYITDEPTIRRNYRAYKSAFPDADIYYAMKANWNITILKILKEEGAGVDVFSSGELYIALLAGMNAERMLFNGNSKRDDELEMSIASGVKISMDSIDELRTASNIAQRYDHEVRISFRVNPDVSPDTHPKIATGLRTTKFGIPFEEIVKMYRMALELPNVRPVGIHCHIGSQILNLSVFGETMEKMMNLVEKISSLGIDLEFVDLGGGLGIAYRMNEGEPTPKDLAEIITPIFEQRCEEIGVHPKLILEPGRSIVGDSTILLARVNTMKKAYKNFVGIDAGYNILIRPVMFDGYHEVIIANKADQIPEEEYTIAGPICEAGDILATDRRLPRIEKGDLIAFLDTGAYCFPLTSQYNGRPRCAEVIVCNGRFDLIRKRETFDDLLHNQIVPARFL